MRAALALALLTGCVATVVNHGPVTNLDDALVDDALAALEIEPSVTTATSFTGVEDRWDGGNGWTNHGEYDWRTNSIRVAKPMPWLLRAICHEPLHRLDNVLRRMTVGSPETVHAHWAESGNSAREQRCQAALGPRFDGGVYVPAQQLTGSSGGAP